MEPTESLPATKGNKEIAKHLVWIRVDADSDAALNLLA